MSGVLGTPIVLIEDVAAELNVSPTTLREWCRRGKFPCFKKAGQRRLWLRSDWIDAWLDGAEIELRRERGGGFTCRPIVRKRVKR
jgi:Helix-turn-helix domain